MALPELAYAYVYVGDTSVDSGSLNLIRDNAQCERLPAANVLEPSTDYRLSCQHGPVWGRYVFLQKSSVGLTICELQVYAESGKNVQNINVDIPDFHNIISGTRANTTREQLWHDKPNGALDKNGLYFKGNTFKCNVMR